MRWSPPNPSTVVRLHVPHAPVLPANGMAATLFEPGGNRCSGTYGLHAAVPLSPPRRTGSGRLGSKGKAQAAQRAAGDSPAAARPPHNAAGGEGPGAAAGTGMGAGAGAGAPGGGDGRVDSLSALSHRLEALSLSPFALPSVQEDSGAADALVPLPAASVNEEGGIGLEASPAAAVFAASPAGAVIAQQAPGLAAVQAMTSGRSEIPVAAAAAAARVVSATRPSPAVLEQPEAPLERATAPPTVVGFTAAPAAPFMLPAATTVIPTAERSCTGSITASLAPGAVAAALPHGGGSSPAAAAGVATATATASDGGSVTLQGPSAQQLPAASGVVDAGGIGGGGGGGGAGGGGCGSRARELWGAARERMLGSASGHDRHAAALYREELLQRRTAEGGREGVVVQRDGGREAAGDVDRGQAAAPEHGEGAEAEAVGESPHHRLVPWVKTGHGWGVRGKKAALFQCQVA